ncbi:Na+/H+ antiporter NhaA [Streptomyces sp. NPDC090493]|uniref:Na+/H+ antiporter NhaA n=1 Tax=Streptomyces sp. NPDC090493 TaxID=3365964 RepID=UPI0037FD05AF
MALQPPTPHVSGQTTSTARSPLRKFLRTETGSAIALLGATVAALAWANISPGSYASLWDTDLSVRLGALGLSQSLREWINNGLMALFFFVIGLEARREFDIGDLRERRRITLAVLAGAGGMVVPVMVYLAINAGHDSVRAWGTAMSTDTAFALGMLALLGSRVPDGLRTFILTVTVVDDFLSLGVIAVAYSGHISMTALLLALGILGVTLLVTAAGVRRGLVYALLGAAAWLALLKSGVDAVATGLALGLMAYAHPAARSDLERASSLFRLFREQPTSGLERSVRVGLASAISPNERLQRMYHPWTSYGVVPLFALANAGITLDVEGLSRAFESPITLGIIFAYLLGKPVGILGTEWIVTTASRGRLRSPVGWGIVSVGGTIAGMGFTVSLLIATVIFHGQQLEEAKVGILSAAICAFAATWLVTAVIGALPQKLSLRMLSVAEGVVDLAVSVHPLRDHAVGPADAPVTIVEYGDFECPYCGQVERATRELLAQFGDVRYVWRHLPLTDVHPYAQLAAEAAEAAALQHAFWPMHDLLLDHQGALGVADLLRYAKELDLDVERFRRDLRTHHGAARIAADVQSADLSGVSGTPTFFINGRRHHGAYDFDALVNAVQAARERAALE